MKKLVCLLAAVLFCQGCCSIFCGSSKTVKITSNPSEAKFSIKDKKGTVIHTGTTPATVTLKRGGGYFSAANYTVTAEKEGCGSETVQVKQGLETGWYLGNIVFGGLIGMVIVDPLTGGMYNINDINVDIKGGSAPATQNAGAEVGKSASAEPTPTKATEPKTGKIKAPPGYRATDTYVNGSPVFVPEVD